MKAVVHVVATVAVLDVHVVGVSPAEWPGIDEGEPVAAVVKAPIIVVAAADMETVPVAKTRLVALVGNAAMLVASFDASGRLCLLRARLAPSGIALRRAGDRMRLLLPLGTCCLLLWLPGGPGLFRLLPWRRSGLPLLLRCRPGLLLGGPSLLRVSPLRIGGKTEYGKQDRYYNWE